MGTSNRRRTRLRDYYTIFLEIGLIASLLIFIIAMKADLPDTQKTVDLSGEREAITVPYVPQTETEPQPPAPADPSVPAKAPTNDDPVIDEPDLDMDTEPNDTPRLKPPSIKFGDKDETIFEAVEQEPQIVGGQQALYNQLEYPARCKRAGIQGRVILQFVVNTDGSVQNIEVERGIGGGCDEAAINALKKVTFKPGKQRGKPVRVRYHWPVLFQLK